MKRKELKEQVSRILINGGKDIAESNIILRNIPSFEEVSRKKAKRIMKIAKKRCKNVPLQYLLGNTTFLDVTIRCNKNVLIPRPETEYLTDIVIKQEKSTKSALDLCCGSGCIGLAIKKHTDADVDLVDISCKAVKEGRLNAKNNDLQVKIIHSNLFDKIISKYDLIVSNPPYIKTEDLKTLQEEVRKEPKIALDGGKDGCDFYRRIIKQAPPFLNTGGKIYLELGQGQSEEVSKLLKENFKNIVTIKDYNGIDRVIYATLK